MTTKVEDKVNQLFYRDIRNDLDTKGFVDMKPWLALGVSYREWVKLRSYHCMCSEIDSLQVQLKRIGDALETLVEQKKMFPGDRVR